MNLNIYQFGNKEIPIRIRQLPINIGILHIKLDDYLFGIGQWTPTYLELDTYFFGIGQLLNSDWTTNYLLATTYLELDNYLFRIGQLIIPYL